MGFVLEPEFYSIHELPQRKGGAVHAYCAGDMDDEGFAVPAFRTHRIAVCIVLPFSRLVG